MKSSQHKQSRSGTSAVVVTWNAAKIIEECIQSIADQTRELLEIIIVDNNSSDDTCSIIEEKFASPQSKVTLLRQNENTGFARGNNIGIEYAFKNAECQNILLLNADARLDKHWLEIIEPITKHQDFAAAQGLTLNYYDHQKVDAQGIVVNRNGQAVQLGFGETRKKTYKDQMVFGVNAAAALYSRSFLEAQPFKEYFDESLYMYYEDVDLALRAQVMGKQSYFVGRAIAYHMGSASKIKSRAERLMVRNAPLILLKNLPFSVLKKLAIKFTVVQTKRVFGHLRRGNWQLFGAAILGIFQSLLYLPLFVYKRHQLSPHRHKHPEELWNQM